MEAPRGIKRPGDAQEQSIAKRPALSPEQQAALDNQLFEALRSEDLNGLANALKMGANANAANDEGRPALIYALSSNDDIFIDADEKREQAATLLLNHGADPNVHQVGDGGGYEGVTPLHFCGVYGFPKLATLLLQKGADLEARDAYEGTPLFTAFDEGAGGTSVEDLKIRNAVGIVLLRANADVDAQTRQGCTPLQAALQCAPDNIIEYMIKKCRNVNPITNGIFTPLQFALERDSEKAALLLLAKGANPDINVPRYQHLPVTALDLTTAEYAAYHLKTETLKRLIQKGSPYSCEKLCKAAVEFNDPYSPKLARLCIALATDKDLISMNGLRLVNQRIATYGPDNPNFPSLIEIRKIFMQASPLKNQILSRLGPVRTTLLIGQPQLNPDLQEALHQHIAQDAMVMPRIKAFYIKGLSETLKNNPEKLKLLKHLEEL